MKVTCRYSGKVFETNGFKHVHAKGVHPMMELPLSQMLPLIGQWSNGELSEYETELLFVALLKYTDLVHFTVPVMPTWQTICLHMEQLIKFVSFLDSVSSPKLVFPSVAIRPDNRTLRNMREILDAWYEEKANWEDKFKTAALNQKLAAREAQLEKLIKSPLGDQSRKVDLLAKWTMDATGAPANMREYWISLFKLKLTGIEIFQARAEGIAGLVEHMELNLIRAFNYNTGWFAKIALDHMREIQARNLQGLRYSVGMPEDELATVDFSEIDNWKLVEDDVEEINRKRVAASAPLEQPKREHYKDTLSYLRARSAWLVAQSVRVTVTEVAKKQEEEISEDGLDNVEDEELPDPRQLGFRLVKREDL